MRRALRRSLLVLGIALFAAGIAPREAAAQFVPDPAVRTAVKTPARLAAAKQKLSPKERAAEAAKKKEETQARLSHIWILGREANRPALLFARINGDDVRLSLSCLSEGGLVRVIVYDVPAKGIKTGDGGRVRLSNGPARVEVAATALPNEKNSRAVDFGGTTKVSPRLFSLIENGDTMVVEVPGRTTGVPLKTLGPKAEAFKRACLAQR